MPNPSPLAVVILTVLEGHLDPTLVPAIAIDTKKILANQAEIFLDLAEILDNQNAAKLVAASIAADVLSIKTFLGGSDTVATQADLDKLGAKLTAGTAAVQQFDQTTSADQLAPGPTVAAPQTTTIKEQQTT